MVGSVAAHGGLAMPALLPVHVGVGRRAASMVRGRGYPGLGAADVLYGSVVTAAGEGRGRGRRRRERAADPGRVEAGDGGGEFDDDDQSRTSDTLRGPPQRHVPERTGGSGPAAGGQSLVLTPGLPVRVRSSLADVEAPRDAGRNRDGHGPQIGETVPNTIIKREREREGGREGERERERERGREKEREREREGGGQRERERKRERERERGRENKRR